MPPRRRLLAAALLLPLASSRAQQAGSALQDLRLVRTDDGFRLSYGARLELPKPMEDALQRGVPLYFVAEVQITRSRWYWRDTTVVRSSRQWRLTYQALTRQYRLSMGGLHQGFDTLGEALASVARVSGWALELREDLQASATYLLNFRLRLDISQLPGPMQIGLGLGAALDVVAERPLSVGELTLPAPRE